MVRREVLHSFHNNLARRFKEGVILAVNHDGDSDSTGSITGNLLGTFFGAKRIPQEWINTLELREVITELAEDLYGFRGWEIGVSTLITKSSINESGLNILGFNMNLLDSA